MLPKWSSKRERDPSLTKPRTKNDCRIIWIRFQRIIETESSTNSTWIESTHALPSDSNQRCTLLILQQTTFIAREYLLNKKYSRHPLSSINYQARKLSTISTASVPELDDSSLNNSLDDSLVVSGDTAGCVASLFREVSIPEISWI